MANDMDSFLMHYGVKGQKKGMRRYQNEDGSYTAEGREHYGIGNGMHRESIVSKQPMTQSSGHERPKASSIQKLVSNYKKSKGETTKEEKSKKQKREYSEEDKKQMKAHRRKWLGKMSAITASAISQKIVSRYKGDPKYQGFYKTMTAINTASIAINALSASHHANEYQRIKHPERYKS